MSEHTREAWLLEGVKHLKPVFKRHGFKVPRVKVSVGFPGGRGGKRAIAQHWSPKASADGVGSIFIHPKMDDSVEALDSLAHELVHAVTDGAGHGPVFKACAHAVGLTKGSMRYVGAGPELLKELKTIVDKIGFYPHARLNLELSPIKKQTTRMIKMECRECGYIVRSSRKSIAEHGAVLCPCNTMPMRL